MSCSQAPYPKLEILRADKNSGCLSWPDEPDLSNFILFQLSVWVFRLVFTKSCPEVSVSLVS